jgi:hypothetical protein
MQTSRQAPEADGGDLDEHIARLVDEAPPLGPEQRDRLAVLLNPAGRLSHSASLAVRRSIYPRGDGTRRARVDALEDPR